jgi:hypothetical protein
MLAEASGCHNFSANSVNTQKTDELFQESNEHADIHQDSLNKAQAMKQEIAELVEEKEQDEMDFGVLKNKLKTCLTSSWKCIVSANGSLGWSANSRCKESKPAMIRYRLPSPNFSEHRASLGICRWLED